MLSEATPGTRWRTDWLVAAVFLAALALYCTTVSRTVQWYDSAEFAAAAQVLGIPHPPGYPLYTMLGRLYVLLLPGEPAFAVNVMSAVHGALGVALVFLVQRQLGAGRWGALLGASLFATGRSFWLNSTLAEVYTTGIVFLLLTFALVVHGVQTRSANALIAGAFVGGLGFSAHMFVATAGLGLAWLVWHGAGPRGAAWRAKVPVLWRAAVATLAGASLYLYVPIRSAMHPAINSAHVADADRFLWILTGGNYKHWFLADYDLGTRFTDVAALVAGHLGPVGSILGIAGLVAMLAREPVLGTGLVLAAAGNLWFFFAYNVQDLEVFFLPTAVVLCLCIGPLVARIRAALGPNPLARATSVAAPVFAAGYLVIRVGAEYGALDLSRDRSARTWGEQVAASLPRDAAILDFSTTPEWKYKAVWEYYFQRALGDRPDVLTLMLPSREMLFQAFDRGPVYVYVPDEAQAYFDLVPEGPLYQIRLRSVPGVGSGTTRVPQSPSPAR